MPRPNSSRVDLEKERNINIKYCLLLYRHECFTGNYTTRNIYKKLHPDPEWFIFHNVTPEFIDYVISVISLRNFLTYHFFEFYCKQCLILLYCKFEPSHYFLATKNLLFYRCLFVCIIKRTLHGGLKI